MTGSVTVWRRAVVGAVGAAVLAWPLAGCGEEDPDEGTNGVAKLSPEEIEREARQAAEAASSVRLSGDVITADEQVYTLDVRLGADGGSGEVASEDGGTFELLRVEDELYLRASDGFWEAQEESGGIDPEVLEELETDPLEKLAGKYVRVHPEDPAYAELSGFTDLGVLLDGLLALDGEREAGERGEVDGVGTIQVLADGGAGGALDVSLEGTPYPLRLARGGAAGELTLSEWDEEFEFTVPAEDEVVDYGERLIEGGESEGDGDG